MNIPPSGVILAITGLYSFYMTGKLENDIKYLFLFVGIISEIAAYLIFRMYNIDYMKKNKDSIYAGIKIIKY